MDGGNNDTNAIPVGGEDYAVEVVSLGFGYPGAQRYSLQDVKLSLPKGKKIHMTQLVSSFLFLHFWPLLLKSSYEFKTATHKIIMNTHFHDDFNPALFAFF